jgi:hypothetical protein
MFSEKTKWRLFLAWCRLRGRKPTFSEMMTGGWDRTRLPGYWAFHVRLLRLRGRCTGCAQKLPQHKFGCSQREGRGLVISLHDPDLL